MKKTLGILVHHIHDPNRFLPLISIALEEGFENAVLFTPRDVHLKSRRIYSYVYENKNWNQIWVPFPSICYDIGYYSDPYSIQMVKRIKQQADLPFIGYGLGNKWTIQKHLKTSPLLSPHLLPTELAEHIPLILSMVKKYHSVMIKPLNGKGGKGIIRLSLTPEGYKLQEASSDPQFLPEQDLKAVLQRYLQGGKYIVQKWVDIRDRRGYVFDIRVLMQRNKWGKWQMTGMGVRQGTEEKITSNLTGGGHAFQVFPFLKEQFRNKAKEIYAKIEQIARYIPSFLEESYGKRLAELGLDIAVDRNKHIWLIEVNIKPGKTLWKRISDMEVDRESLRAPIQYAWFLLESRKTRESPYR